MTKSTEIDYCLFSDSDGDVCFGNSASWTDVSDSWNELNTTHRT